MVGVTDNCKLDGSVILRIRRFEFGNPFLDQRQIINELLEV